MESLFGEICTCICKECHYKCIGIATETKEKGPSFVVLNIQGILGKLCSINIIGINCIVYTTDLRKAFVEEIISL